MFEENNCLWTNRDIFVEAIEILICGRKYQVILLIYIGSIY